MNVHALPCDWDHVSYCTVDECPNPATHSQITGMANDTPVYDLVCCTHAGRTIPAGRDT